VRSCERQGRLIPIFQSLSARGALHNEEHGACVTNGCQIWSVTCQLSNSVVIDASMEVHEECCSYIVERSMRGEGERALRVFPD
jgi:hypothetical protein